MMRQKHFSDRSFLRIVVLLVFTFVIAVGVLPHASGASPIGPKTEALDLSSYQQVRHVAEGAGSDDSGDGSKSRPWKSIRHALEQSKDAGAKNRYAVLVAQGTYGSATIHMKENVDLFGGFEPTTWKRDIWRHTTILDGGRQRRVLVAASRARIDGFEIRNGLVRGKGAALLCDGASPSIVNNRFVGNKTLGPEGWNPKYLHESANDGGAIYCGNGAAPLIANNIFSGNETEVGRGAAVAVHDHSGGRIANNAFLHNRAGVDDPMRSSDGGAMSMYDWANPTVENNVILGNRALASNDGGGIFVTLWASPAIRGNIFVNNDSGDDAGALFIGGQEHRYDQPLDPLPPKKDFFIEVTGNKFFGNSNPSRNSGAMRATKQTRGLFANNIVAHNSGFYIQRSEATVVNNTILENARFVETLPALGPSIIANNIIWGEFEFDTKASVTHCNIRDGFEGEGNISAAPRFVDDWKEITALSSTYNRSGFVTDVYVSGSDLKADELVGRVVRAGERWGVVKSNQSNRLTVWGDMSGEVRLFVLPTYHLHPDSPDIDKGTRSNAPEQDVDGDRRPSDNGVDIGADEFRREN